MGNAVLTDNPVSDKVTERGEETEQKLLYAASGMKGWRQSMEDSHTICLQIVVNGRALLGHSLLGVYDGHGGSFTSKFCGENFVRVLSETENMKAYSRLAETGNESRSDANGIELLHNALEESFRIVDDELRQEQTKRNRDFSDAVESTEMQIERSGATCCVVLLTPSHILCANAGDSRAILQRSGHVLPLSFDHKPIDIPEQERIADADGFVSNKRVNGDLAVSRALGDFGFKSNASLPYDQQPVICVPEIVVCPRKKDGDEYVVLACDGVWDVLDNQGCGKIVQTMFDEGESDIGLVCEEVLDTCLEKKSRDNMTIVMMCFEAASIQKNRLLQKNVVLSRRASRSDTTITDDTVFNSATQDAFGKVASGIVCF